MLDKFLKSKIAIIGGGNFCKKLLQLMFSEPFEDCHPTILAVADTDAKAAGFVYAKQLGIFTTDNYLELYRLKDLQVLMELTADIVLGGTINKQKPDDVELIDHVHARTVWSALQVEAEKRTALKELRQNNFNAAKIDLLFEGFADRLANVINERSARYVEIERELIESEKALSQIIEGSTIPTFVLNKDHVVTYWNKAMEKFTGTRAETMVGSTRPSTPFWGEERPTMADVILDQISEDEIKKLYGETWRKSALIEEAYEAEVFFPRLGESGKWCWFTAAPIKSPDGTIVGSIETLWDKTEDKRAEEEREKHTQELSTLCSIYSALNASYALEARIHQTALEIKHFLSADGLCIYLLEDDGKFHLRYNYGLSWQAAKNLIVADDTSYLYMAAQAKEYKIIDGLSDGYIDELCHLAQEKLFALAYIPISGKQRSASDFHSRQQNVSYSGHESASRRQLRLLA
ncbi:MAG: PAS domain-containing protein [Desulfobacterales bacterium]